MIATTRSGVGAELARLQLHGAQRQASGWPASSQPSALIALPPGVWRREESRKPYDFAGISTRGDVGLTQPVIIEAEAEARRRRRGGGVACDGYSIL